MPHTCPYCSRPAVLVDGERVYPHRPDLARKKFWLCSLCNAWVGCHPGTETPLGRLADKDLRNAKRAAHDAFDPLWQGAKRIGSKKKRAGARSRAYSILATELGIPAADCHIGMFDLETCRRALAVMPKIAEKLREKA